MMVKARKSGKPKIWSLKRTMPLVGIALLLVLGLSISALAYVLARQILISQYNANLTYSVNYIESNTDVDDLKECVKTGESSPKRDELQLFLNTMVDDLGWDYIYIVIPTPEGLVNVVSATNAAEIAAGESDMPLLYLESESYSAEALRQYRSYWNTYDVSFFEESSDYGRYYTAVKPLRASDGETVALLCIDDSSEDMLDTLRYVTVVSASLMFFVVAIVCTLAYILLHYKVIRPIISMADSARDYSRKSQGLMDISELTYDKPSINTKELSELASAIEKMANNMSDYVRRILFAEHQVKEAEEQNIRLTEQARAREKIEQLTESINSLFFNMPVMAFSKDAKDGVYLACNQLYANYVHRASPQDVIGLRDSDMFCKESAKHFRAMDEIALSMDTPYMFFEEIKDVDGVTRKFQTTKVKYIDGQGKLCILGMCLDSTELEKLRKQSVAAQEAYEQARSENLTYSNIARALAMDYSYLYYVDLEDNRFWEYRSDLSSEDIVLERRGEDFFSQSRKDALERIYTDDQDGFLAAFTKENVLSTIDAHGMFTLSYRLMVDGKPLFFNMKIMRMTNDNSHLVVGVNNVDAQIRAQEEIERVREERITYERITAISGPYICIYTVDPETEHFVGYNTNKDYSKLNLEKEGDNFFEMAQRDAVNNIYEPDQPMFLDTFRREKVLEEIKTSGVFVLNYRLMLNDVPTYVRLKAAMVKENKGSQLIVGISNVDAQTKREQEYSNRLNAERRKANLDALTGLSNKHAYIDAEEELNRSIEEGKPVEFAVVVLDINGLKQTNDLHGHRQGDKLIKKAAQLITDVFTASPVYRVGGDEFVVIAKDDEYKRIDELIKEIAAKNKEHLDGSGVIVACGMARYKNEKRVSDVFERADKNMYQNKNQLKSN